MDPKNKTIEIGLVQQKSLRVKRLICSLSCKNLFEKDASDERSNDKRDVNRFIKDSLVERQQKIWNAGYE